MTTFVFTFAYSVPYVPLIPPGGINPTPTSRRAEPVQHGAVKYRQDIHGFVDAVRQGLEQGARPVRRPGLAPPAYAQNQYEQWPLSIEI